MGEARRILGDPAEAQHLLAAVGADDDHGRMRPARRAGRCIRARCSACCAVAVEQLPQPVARELRLGVGVARDSRSASPCRRCWRTALSCTMDLSIVYSTIMPKTPAARALRPAVTRAIAMLRLLSRSRDAADAQGDRRGAGTGAEHRAAHPARARGRAAGPGRSAHQAVQPGRRHAAAGPRRAGERRLSRPWCSPCSTSCRSATASRRSASRLPDLDHMVVVALARSAGAGAPARRCRQPLPRPDQRHRPLPRGLRRASVGRDREALPPRCAGTTRRAYETWRKEVEQARRQGFSIDRGNYIAGVTIVAVPVLNGRHDDAHARRGRPQPPARPHDRDCAGARHAVRRANGGRAARIAPAAQNFENRLVKP